MLFRKIISKSTGGRGNPPVCHSEPIGEESRLVYFYFALLEILRFAQDDKLGFIGMILCGRAGACSRRLCPLSEGAVKCVAFDWGRDFSVSLPPPFASGKSHLPLRGRGYGAPSRRPLQRGAESSPPTHEIEYVCPHKPKFVILSEAKDLKPKYKMCESRFFGNASEGQSGGHTVPALFYA